jgi:ATP-binding protein involved in chromosome partitioning
MSLDAQLKQILSQVPDKELGLTASEMGLKYQVTSANKTLTLTLTAGFPVSPLHKTYIPSLLSALQSAFPQYSIQIDLESHIKPHRTQMPGKGLREVKNTIAIASGKGGVGKSTITVNLAIALAKLGARVGILDADIYGPSIPCMLGKTGAIEICEDQYVPISVQGIQAMSIGYLTDQTQALIWRGPMLAKSLLQMLNMTQWNALDYLLIDLPPGTGDIQLSLVQKIPLTSAIVITTPQQVATLDAQKAITLFRKTGIDVLGVIENMANHICSACNHQEALFGHGGAEKLCEQNQCSLLGQLPLDPRILEQCDTGMPEPERITPLFLATALNTAIALAKKPLNYAHSFPNIQVEYGKTTL